MGRRRFEEASVRDQPETEQGSAADAIRRQSDVRAGRFERATSAPAMMAVVTTGAGGLDRLEYREVPRPRSGDGEVLVQVLAAGVNATDVNTRLGWYSESVTDGTADAAGDEGGPQAGRSDGGWSRPTPFPLIQGTDCCGVVTEAGPGADPHLVGRRVLVRPCMRPSGFGSAETVWMGSDFDGAFAQYVKAPSSEAFAVDCDWSDAALGAVPCAYGTAENMLQRARVTEGEDVVVTGASGGVGSAALQLAGQRGARVTAVTHGSRSDAVLAMGAAAVVDRERLPEELPEHSVDVVVDNVAGGAFPTLLRALRRGGRYVSSGAIAGPMLTLDARVVYLNDLTLLGCTAWDEPVFPRLLTLIARGELRPPLVATYALADIADAQRAFLEKRHVGKLALIPPAG
jgi:NADPH:quinone reductase-like Zn-dependent oxidoreductase